MLKGKVAIVTGGTRGIGYSIVKTYLENGAKVVLFGSKEESVNKALASLKAENADWEVSGAWPNLCNPEELTNAINDVKAKYGKLDILVNNAGISDSTPITAYDPAHFAQVIDINVNAMATGCIAAAKIMIEQHEGCIINTSSMVSISAQSSGFAYPTSKFAVNGLTLALARELGPQGIRVNAVAPGITNTDMVSALPDEVIKPMIAYIPLRRIGEPQDIANAFLYLASDMASYVSGEVLSVDGVMRA